MAQAADAPGGGACGNGHNDGVGLPSPPAGEEAGGEAFGCLAKVGGEEGGLPECVFSFGP
jgi:hypothetical protein